MNKRQKHHLEQECVKLDSILEAHSLPDTENCVDSLLLIFRNGKYYQWRIYAEGNFGWIVDEPYKALSIDECIYAGSHYYINCF